MIAAEARDRDRFPYRMKDLCEASGLERQAIHFYIQQGLLPAGQKTGKNMAWYGAEHVERLQLIRRLQHERFLPLKAIKALLDGSDEQFSDEQQAFLRDLKDELSPSLTRALAEERTTVDIQMQLAPNNLSREDIEGLVEAGVLAATLESGGAIIVAEDDLWLIELFGAWRAAGFTDARGFTPLDLGAYTDAIDAIIKRDAEMIAKRLGKLPPQVVAKMVEQGVPEVSKFLSRYYERRVLDFFSVV